MTQTTATQTSNGSVDKEAIRPFEINIPAEAIADLRRRVVETRWPEKEPVADQTQGVPLATMQNSQAIGERITTGASVRRN